MVKTYALRAPTAIRAIRYTDDSKNIDEIRELTKMNIVSRRTFGDVLSSLSDNFYFNAALTFRIGDWIIVDGDHIRIMDDINFNKTYLEVDDEQ